MVMFMKGSRRVKKIITLILVTVMLAIPSFNVSADNAEKMLYGIIMSFILFIFPADGIWRIMSSVRRCMVKYISEAKSLSVVSRITSIGDAAFIGLYMASDVNIGDDVKGIGSYAFSICHSMTRIKLPASPEEIDE